MITLKSIRYALTDIEVALDTEYCVALNECNTDAMARIEDDLNHLDDLWDYYEPLVIAHGAAMGL